MDCMKYRTPPTYVFRTGTVLCDIVREEENLLARTNTRKYPHKCRTCAFVRGA